MTEPTFKIPDAIGDYRVDGRLGAGGMGEVFRGWDPALERPVAIKVIRSDAQKNPAGLERFRREALAIAHLDHPSIVRIHHVQKWREYPCLVMELVEGESLAQILDRGALPIATAVPLLGQIASGLGAAHAKGIVHRDLKAHNVMLTPEGRAKILDFGIAKRLQGSDESLSVSGAIIGTLHTMSPEQAAGRPVDGRADLFALGVLAYEMLSGTSPFRADTAVETLARIIGHHPRGVRTVAPQVSQPLSELIDRLLAKDPNDRPSTAGDVADWFESWCADHLEAQTRQPRATRPAEGGGNAGPEPVTGPESASPSLTGLPTLEAGRPAEPGRVDRPDLARHADDSHASGTPSGRLRASHGVGKRRVRRWVLSAVAMLCVLAAFYWSSVRPHGPWTVAMVGLAPEGSNGSAWQTRLLEEALMLGLRDHPDLRVLDGESMAHLRRVLGHPEPLAIDALDRLRSTVSTDLADVIVTGSWRQTDGAWDVTLDLLRADTKALYEVRASGATVSEVVEATTAPVADALGLGRVSPQASERFSNLLPVGAETLQLYAEGLLADQSGDLTTARSRYREALALEADHAELHRAYAVASDLLGYETEAKQAAEKAVELAGLLSSSAGATVRAAGFAISGEIRSAIETYEHLFERHPDELAFAIEAVRLRSLSDDNLTALATITQLRPLVSGTYGGLLDLVEARVRNDTGDFVAAKELAHRAAAIGARDGLLDLEAEGRLLEGTALAHLGEHDAAGRAVDKAHLLFRRMGDRRRASDALLENALLLYEQGRGDAALDYLQRYEQIFAERDDPWSLAMLANNMGIMRIHQGRLQEACDLFEGAIPVFERRGDLLELAQALLNLGAAHHWNGDLDAAVAAYERAEPIFLQLGDRPHLASVRINIGEIHRDKGALGLATAATEEALALERELARPTDISYALNRLGELALLRADTQAAREHFTASLSLVEGVGDASSLAHARLGMAQVELAASNAGRAETLAVGAEQLFLDSGDLPAAHRSAIHRARALLQRSPPVLDLAREIYDNVHLGAGQIEDWRVRVELALLAAQLAVEAREDPARRIRVRLEELIMDSEAAGLVLDAQLARLSLGELELAVGAVETGRGHLQKVLETARANGWALYAARAARHLED